MQRLKTFDYVWLILTIKRTDLNMYLELSMNVFAWVEKIHRKTC